MKRQKHRNAVLYFYTRKAKIASLWCGHVVHWLFPPSHCLQLLARELEVKFPPFAAVLSANDNGI
jgi:hypothetical protein